MPISHFEISIHFSSKRIHDGLQLVGIGEGNTTPNDHQVLHNKNTPLHDTDVFHHGSTLLSEL